MKGMLDPVYQEVIIGNAEVRQTFKVSNVGTIAGCYVTNGKIAPGITANGTFTLDTTNSEVAIKYIITPGKIMYNEKRKT